MANINVVSKRVRMGLSDIIKYQIITHCFINHIQITESELSCMTLLALTPVDDLTSFCIQASDQKIFKSTQTVRNCIVKLERLNLIVKEGKNKKKIGLNPDLKIQITGNVLLDFKIAHLGT